jgi:hypothetical protein
MGLGIRRLHSWKKMDKRIFHAITRLFFQKTSYKKAEIRNAERESKDFSFVQILLLRYNLYWQSKG